MNNKIGKLISIFTVFVIQNPAHALELEGTSAMTVNVSVTVQNRTCDIYPSIGTTINVDFETITKKGIEDGQYKLPVSYRVYCSDSGAVMTVALSGTASSFDSTLLKVNENSDLGFQFNLDDRKWGFNTPSGPFRSAVIPKITVIPKLKPGATNLTGGAFTSASASLILSYQ